MKPELTSLLKERAKLLDRWVEEKDQRLEILTELLALEERIVDAQGN